MKPELEQQKQIAAEAWAEAERKFLAAVGTDYWQARRWCEDELYELTEPT
jgi:hypothetical protein